MSLRSRLVAALAMAAIALTGARVGAQVAMPDPKQISGVPLQTADLAAGTISVRVIRGSFENNLPGVAVDFVVDGQTKTVTTGQDGRAQIANLRPGAHVKASATVAGERLESQDITVGTSGIRLVLTATDPATAAEATQNQALAAGPAVAGTVVLGPDSRIVADFSQDRLNIYYVAQVMNTARTPVDIGGPLIFDLPTEAAGATLLQESTKQAIVKSNQVIVTGPFAPGATNVEVAFSLPAPDGSARIVQRWPAATGEMTVLALKSGDIDLSSAQIAEKRVVTDQGQLIVAGQVPALAAGQPLTFDITGLPHHAAWPRYTALALAGLVITLGIWGAAAPPKTRQPAA